MSHLAATYHYGYRSLLNRGMIALGTLWSLSLSQPFPSAALGVSQAPSPESIANLIPLPYSRQIRRLNLNLRIHLEHHPHQPTPQPARLSAPNHLPPANNLVLVRSQPHHRLHPLWRLLPLRHRLSLCSIIWLAPRSLNAGSGVWGPTGGGQVFGKVSRKSTVYFP